MVEDEAVDTDDRNITTGGPKYCVPSHCMLVAQTYFVQYIRNWGRGNCTDKAYFELK